jgi:cyclohexa-1,5-dienecarbonyl-CoA hydratase
VRNRVRIVQEADGHWVRLVMESRPGNLLSLEMVRGLHRALDTVAARRELRWLTVEGAGDDFSFGARIQEHLPEPMRVVLPETHALFKRWLAVSVPTAAIVHGRCLGGGFELALCCDDILAASDAQFGLPEIALAAFPPAGAVLLPIRVGASRAARAVVTGDRQSAAYWHDAGLVSLAAGGRAVIDAARAWFEARFAPRSATALGMAALASRAVLRAQAEPLLDELEQLYLGELLSTEDAIEGVRAWMEKREPRWSR